MMREHAAPQPERPATRTKLEGGKRLEMASDFSPAGDQPSAIAELVRGIETGEGNQILPGVTGIGKTF